MFDEYHSPWPTIFNILFTGAVSWGSYSAGKNAGIKEMTDQQRDQEILMLRRELEKLRATQFIENGG